MELLIYKNVYEGHIKIRNSLQIYLKIRNPSKQIKKKKRRKRLKYDVRKMYNRLIDSLGYGILEDYQTFYLTNKEFVRKSGLSHQTNMYKMRVLTLLERATNLQVLSFSALKEKLDLDENSFEEFSIDGVKSKLVHPKIN